MSELEVDTTSVSLIQLRCNPSPTLNMKESYIPNKVATAAYEKNWSSSKLQHKLYIIDGETIALVFPSRAVLWD